MRRSRASKTPELDNQQHESCPPHLALLELLSSRLSEVKRITFAEFMATVLYHPSLGYYRSAEARIGLQGDYYTSPHVHPLFGAAIADQLAEVWELLGRPDPFTIVECGAASGRLATHILGALRANWAEAHSACRYWLVDVSRPSAPVENALRDLAYDPGRVAWFSGLDEMPTSIVGCVLSNELIDAFPVHRVKRARGKLTELYVVLRRDGSLGEAPGDLSTAELGSYLADQQIQLANYQEAEVNLAARSWLQQVASVLERGFVLTIDYGYRALDLYGARFPKGTLVCYRRHQLSDDPFEALGCQDITAHVNFTALERWGEALGMGLVGFTTQMKFLLALGILPRLERYSGLHPQETALDAAAIKQLIMPGGMGETFKVLAQSKGIEGARLSGFRSPW